MEDFSKEELVQFINFYKNRAADLEFQYLQLQLKFNKLSSQEPVPAAKTVKEKS